MTTSILIMIPQDLSEQQRPSTQVPLTIPSIPSGLPSIQEPSNPPSVQEPQTPDSGPFNRVQAHKRSVDDDISYSVGGEHLRKRRRVMDSSRNLTFAELQKQFPGEIRKENYCKALGLPRLTKLTLEQGKFLLHQRLHQLDLKLKVGGTPPDGSCMFHALFDQIQGQPSLKDYADSHHELRFKLVCEGYSKFLETEKS